MLAPHFAIHVAEKPEVDFRFEVHFVARDGPTRQAQVGAVGQTPERLDARLDEPTTQRVRAVFGILLILDHVLQSALDHLDVLWHLAALDRQNIDYGCVVVRRECSANQLAQIYSVVRAVLCALYGSQSM